MYLTFYRLTEKPFQIAADPKFLWLGEKHKEALAALRYGILDNKGFLLLTGDVGTGKTTLINTLIKSLGDDIIAATVPDPGLDQIDLFNFIADAFDMNQMFTAKAKFLIHFKRFLMDANAAGKKVLLIIDESQRLSQELLEEIRLLSNIEKNETKLINIFFIGQNEFNQILLRTQNRAIRQRITINFNIDPLSETETGLYVRHRLAVAGNERPLFSKSAIREVYHFSQGYPRLINVICDYALLSGYVKEAKTVSGQIVRECARELSIPEIRTGAGGKKLPVRKKKTSARKAWITVCILAAVALCIGLAPLFLPGGYQRTFEDARVAYKPWIEKIKQIRFESPIKLGKQEPNHDPARPIQIPQPQEPVEPGDAGAEPGPVEPPPAFTARIEPEKPSPETGVSISRALSATDGSISQNPKPAETQLPPPPEKSTIRFDYNSNALTDQSFAMLDRLARQLAPYPEARVAIKGFTDRSGNYEYNRKLSEFRANIVKSYLVGKGVNPLRVTTVGMGPVPEKDEEPASGVSRSNRRVEIFIELSRDGS